MAYRQIDESHPYQQSLTWQDREDAPNKLGRIFHPVDSLWPLHSIAVRVIRYQGVDSFTVELDRKDDMDSYWSSSMFRSLPFELMPELRRLLDECEQKRVELIKSWLSY